MQTLPANRWFVAIATITMSVTTTTTFLQAQDRVVRTPLKETPFADVPYEAVDRRVFLSTDGRSVAYVARRPTGEYVSHNGVLVGPYDDVAPRSLTLSADGKRMAFVARCVPPKPQPAAPAVPPPPRRAGHEPAEPPPPDDGRAWHDGTWRVVVDGKPGPLGYERVAEETLRFSADGKTFAFVARRDGRAYAVRDGAESAGYDDVRADGFDLLPDGRLLFVTRRDGVRGGELLVIGNEKSPVMASVGRAKLSADGTRLAYAAKPTVDAEEDVVVVNGEVAARAAGIDARSVAFSPAPGGPIAYVAGAAGERRVYFIGAPAPKAKAYDRIPGDSITFSPDGARLAYVGWRDGMACVVTDGAESDPFYGIKPRTLRFSPDGKRLAYVVDGVTTGVAAADVGHASAVVVDGREGKAYPFVRTAPAFTPDGRHVSYVAQRPSDARGDDPSRYECLVVVDGVEGRPYPWVRAAPVFDRTGTRMAYLAAAGDDRLADADELPRLVEDAPGTGGVLVLDKSLATRAAERIAPRVEPAPDDKKLRNLGGLPVKIVLVEEQLREE